MTKAEVAVRESSCSLLYALLSVLRRGRIHSLGIRKHVHVGSKTLWCSLTTVVGDRPDVQRSPDRSILPASFGPVPQWPTQPSLHVSLNGLPLFSFRFFKFLFRLEVVKHRCTVNLRLANVTISPPLLESCLCFSKNSSC